MRSQQHICKQGLADWRETAAQRRAYDVGGGRRRSVPPLQTALQFASACRFHHHRVDILVNLCSSNGKIIALVCARCRGNQTTIQPQQQQHTITSIALKRIDCSSILLPPFIRFSKILSNQTDNTITMSSFAQPRPKAPKVMVQPINLIFRYLQQRSRVQIWLLDNVNLRIEGILIGFDEYMNLTLDDACEYNVKKNVKSPVGKILLKGENITLIQAVESKLQPPCST